MADTKASPSVTINEPSEALNEISEFGETALLLGNADAPVNYDAIPSERRGSVATLVNSETGSENDNSSPTASRQLLAMISVLLIGVFMSQADATLVLSVYGEIASEFHALKDGSWILTSYMLAMSSTQALYGKLSDIYGRKRCLQTAYILFAIGTLGTGIGQSLTQIIIGRAIQGAGGSGMVGMVSILLTDLVPPRDVALYRSYINVIQTLGRMSGGTFGGLISEAIGWRYAFLFQLIPILTALILVEWKLVEPKKDTDHQNHLQKLKRVDFAGAITLTITILTTLFILDIGLQKYGIHSSIIWLAISLAVISAFTFVWIEKKAAEPIFPLSLLSRFVVVTSYAILALQIMSQMALMYTIPLYFQVTKGATPSMAGLYLVPSVVGNTIGGLLTGIYIKRTGRYKFPTVAASVCSAVAFTSLLILWRGNTNWLEALIVFPAGFGTGVVNSSIFVGLTSGVAENEIAIAGTGLYLSGNIGTVAGISGASAIYQFVLRSNLKSVLDGRPDAAKILKKALSDLNFVQNLGPGYRKLLLPSYVDAVHYVFVFSLVCVVTGFSISIWTREKPLRR